MKVNSPAVHSVVVVGTQVSATTSAAKTTLPNGNDGGRPRAVAFQSNGLAYVRLQMNSAGAQATTGDLMVNGAQPIVLAVGSYDAFSYLSDFGTVKVNCVPVEIG